MIATLEARADAPAPACRNRAGSCRYAFREVLLAGAQYRRIRQVRQFVHPPFGASQQPAHVSIAQATWLARFLLAREAGA